MSTLPAAVDRPLVDRGALLPGVNRLALVLDLDRPVDRRAESRLAAVDNEVGSALLRHVAAGSDTSRGWLRLYRPAPTVGFSTRDSRAPGFAAASAAAAAHGFSPLVRAPGGHAAAYHSGCLCFDLVVSDSAGRVDVVAQLEQWGLLLTRLLRSFGAVAQLGPLPDEYCPGRFSVHAGGAKLVGTAGRRRPGAALVGGVVVVDGADPLRAVIGDVYTALGLPCDLSTVGSLADVTGGRLVPGIAAGAGTDLVAQVASAVVSALENIVSLDIWSLPEQVLDDARTATSHR